MKVAVFVRPDRNLLPVIQRTTMRPDSTLDPRCFETWRQSHAEALRAFPDLEARFTDAARASEPVGEAAALCWQLLDDYQQDAAGRLLQLSVPTAGVPNAPYLCGCACVLASTLQKNPQLTWLHRVLNHAPRHN